MDLRTYLDQQAKTSIRSFANALGVPRQSMWRYATGQATPPAKIMLQIENATNGQVTSRDFMMVAIERSDRGDDASSAPQVAA